MFCTVCFLHWYWYSGSGNGMLFLSEQLQAILVLLHGYSDGKQNISEGSKVTVAKLIITSGSLAAR